jgi:MFS family permease
MISGKALIAAMCAAEVLTMAGVFAFPALLPVFFAEWQLSNTEAGWIAGIYFAAYAVSVPVLVALTDRIDARVVYVGGALLAAVSSAGFAVLAEGFWSGLVLRALAGVALAATYMPGLKVLVDRYQGPRQSRAVALYTSSFSLGTAASFLIAGEITAAFGWRWAFVAAAVAAVVAATIGLALQRVKPQPLANPAPLLDFRPVFANRDAMAYVLGYGVHCWELFTLRSWTVAFLAFSLTLQPVPSNWPAPTSVAMISGLVAMVASVAGNELCVRFGRRRVIRLVMVASVVAAAGFGFTGSLAYGVVVALVLAYAAIVQLDSAALTAGAVEAADPKRRGATMAVHSLIGFGCAFVGPLVLGVVLDRTGGATTSLSWGFAFLSVAAVGLLGPLALRLGGRQSRG